MDAHDDPAPDAPADDTAGGIAAPDVPGTPDAQDVPDVPAAAGGESDGGVLLRLARRTATVAGALGVGVLVITGTGLGWPGWFARPVGLIVGVVLIAACTLGAVVLLRRAGSWTALGAASVRDSPGAPAVVGEPRALHRSERVAMRRRRYPAQVVPIRSAGGPWPKGGVVLVHGRDDGVRLHIDDDLVVHWASPRGPYLLQRPDDGALFAAERSSLGAW